jgi:CheY-like chemotaxis protein
MTPSPAAKVGRDILVVDDDDDIRLALELVLSSVGYSVWTAPHGAEALSLLKADGRARLIMLDLMMPVMNGWEFRAAQLRDPSLAGIPVLIMTGFGGAAEKCASLGAAAALNKPIDFDALLATIATILGSGGSLRTG